jgi:hypothetical protein
MKLEDQVVNLELAKKLKELGVKQDSLFYYQNNPYSDGEECIDLMVNEYSSEAGENVIMNTESDNDNHPKYSAFTVAELGKITSNSFNEWAEGYNKSDSEWYFKYRIDKSYLSCQKNEANARAEFIIHLIENKLIDVEY